MIRQYLTEIHLFENLKSEGVCIICRSPLKLSIYVSDCAAFTHKNKCFIYLLNIFMEDDLYLLS